MRTYVVLLAAIELAFFTQALASQAKAPMLLGYLPSEGAHPVGPAEHFVGQKLFEYMNGGAELYLAYGFVDVGAREYQHGQARATVAVYQMGSPQDAFGIYLTANKGKLVDVGVRAVLSRGMLSFFKGRFYVRVVARSTADTNKVRELLLDLGKRVATKLPGEAKPPPEADLLPKGALNGSLRYLPNPQTARTIWLDGEGDILLSKKARAYTAFYPEGDNDLQATRVVYPSKAAAQTACLALAKKLKLQVKAGKDTCTAAGKDADDLVTLVEAQGAIIRWIGAGADEKSARAWLDRIK